MKKILFVVLMSLGLSACGSSPESSVNSFYKAIDAGDTKGAKEFVSDGLKTMMGSKLDAVLQKRTTEYMAHKGVDSINTSCDTKGDVSVCSTDITFKDGAKKHENDTLNKTDAGWRFNA